MPLSSTKTQYSLKHQSVFRLQSAIVVLVLCVVMQSVYAQVEDGEQTVHNGDITVSAEETPVLDHATQGQGLQLYEASIKPLLKETCFDCHSGDDVEGNFRADQLDPDLAGGKDLAWWLEVYAVLSKGEMPPPESSQLTDGQRIRIVEWLSNEIQEAEKLRKVSGSNSSFRRLTRYEYNYALQDLLGVPWTFASDLPAEASEDDAFENNADSLHMSVKQVETYHQLALKALRRVTVRGDRPPVVHWAVPMKAAFDREKRRLEQDLESTNENLKNTPDKQAEQLERLNRQLNAPADRSHYLELATGLRAEIDWGYRKASYAFRHSDTYKLMPARGSHFAVVYPGSRQALTVELGDQLPDAGTMRVRVRASRAEGVDQPTPSLQLHFGFQATDQGRSIKRVSNHDVQISASYGQPEIYQWDVPLSEIEHRNTYRGEMKLGEQPNPSEYIRFTNSTVEHEGIESPPILIDYVEVAAPIYDVWPPPSHRNVFLESENSHDETAYAREIISAFMARAWRRTQQRELYSSGTREEFRNSLTTDESLDDLGSAELVVSDREIDRKVQLFERLRAGSNDFQEAVIEVLATILTSPKFLYVLPGEQQALQSEAKGQLSQNELASRLSLFLWCSLPDETLLELASTCRLDDAKVLEQQVERMLADPRATRFSKHFVQQWLKMQPLEFLRPTRDDDGFDEALLESIKQEPIALYADMLRRNSSVLDFIISDYLVVNERLAKHYGIPEVRGNHFRRISLPPNSMRGGLLTQAGLLTMNSDGEDSHPVKRGVWLLTNLLNDPPPPPPPAVPEIDLSDPEIAKLTLKERIENHRDHAACRSCHQKIDPWGIAFENYGAMGRWRDQIDGKIVDATSVLPDNVKLDGMKGLKEYLVQVRQEQFVKASVEKMAAFALGRQLDFGDRAAIRDITKRVRASGDGIRTLITCLVTSELFQTK